MKNKLAKITAVVLTMAVYIFAFVVTGSACKRAMPIHMDELFAADLIVRAKAEKYVRPVPAAATKIGGADADMRLILRTTGVPEELVKFKIEEVLKGEKVPETIVLNGYLSKDDDFNDTNPPYKFVRKNGRSGSCFANTYKQGASFLLFLNKTETGYTPNISPLGPTNEQLHGDDDEWLLWTRRELKERNGNKIN